VNDSFVKQNKMNDLKAWSKIKDNNEQSAEGGADEASTADTFMASIIYK
jgi:hypothetical protein